MTARFARRQPRCGSAGAPGDRISGVTTTETWADLYRDLHAHPELSFQETRTAGIVAERLAALGFEVTTGVGITGVVGVLANGDGPTVLLRADMDALPVEERTGLDYASRQRAVSDEGVDVAVMHACGHDVHVTCLLAFARARGGPHHVVRHRARGVPAAEEKGTGAQAIEDGLFSRFPTPAVARQHVRRRGRCVRGRRSRQRHPRITLHGQGYGRDPRPPWIPSSWRRRPSCACDHRVARGGRDGGHRRDDPCGFSREHHPG